MVPDGQNCRRVAVAWACKAHKLLDYKVDYLSQGTKNGTKNDWKNDAENDRDTKTALMPFLHPFKKRPVFSKSVFWVRFLVLKKRPKNGPKNDRKNDLGCNVKRPNISPSWNEISSSADAVSVISN